jgi:hypothetical protein
MPRQISIFAGSFKPPHKGHLAIVKKMLKLTEKPRKGDKGPGYVYVFISKKSREPCSKIDGVVSKKIWEEYISTLPKKEQERVKLVLSNLTSPTQTAYGFVKRLAYPGDIFYLIKSAKDARNTRYSSFKNLQNKNIEIKELILPGFESLHSSYMREFLKKRKKKEFYSYLPPKMKKNEKQKIWEGAKLLC